MSQIQLPSKEEKRKDAEMAELNTCICSYSLNHFSDIIQELRERLKQKDTEKASQLAKITKLEQLDVRNREKMNELNTKLSEVCGHIRKLDDQVSW